MHLFYIPQDRNVHIPVLNGTLQDMEQVHCAICENGLLMISYPWGVQWLGTEPPEPTMIQFIAPNELTLYVLNLSEGTETYIYILCHYSTLISMMAHVLKILPQVR